MLSNGFAGNSDRLGKGDFAFRLIASTPLSTDKNTLLSPFSAQAALSLLLPGMRDGDKAILQKTLGGSTASLSKQMTNGHPELAIANSVWVDSRMKLNAAYAGAVKKQYTADISSFTHSSASLAKINGWVKAKTKNRIPTIIDQLKESDRLIVINAIAFDGEWAKQFSKSRTFEQDFHTSSGDVKQVPMMHLNEEVGFFKNNNLRAIKLNYKGEAFSMYVMLPEHGNDATALLHSMNSKSFEDMAAGFDASQKVDLALPKFKFSDSRQLTEPLKALGLQKLFNEADFSGISAGLARGKIDRVIQKTYVEVDERGTKAAAATGAVMRPTMVLVDRRQFVADRPFAFFIVHNSGRAILFSGVVNNP